MDDLTFSVSQIARSMGAARDTVSRKLAAVGAEPAGERGGHPVYDLRAIVAAFTAQGVKADPSRMNAFELRAFYAAERDRLRLETERGNLISRERHEDCVTTVAKICVRGLVTLPDRVERDKRVAPDVVEYIADCIGDLRDEIADAVAVK